jgi:proteasome beta subunit
VTVTLGNLGPLDEAIMRAGNSSFSRFLSDYSPETLSGRFQVPSGVSADQVRHGTTILAVTFDGGVIIAADRQVTTGSSVSSRRGEKIVAADDLCCIGTAGTAALGVEIAKLFQLELEHYEKIEGSSLSFDGKVNRLSKMIYENLAMAMQGLTVVPLLTGFDLNAGYGRIFSYDAVGGRNEEFNFHAIGSGSIHALGSLKKMHHDTLSESDAVDICLQALYDASEDDIYTMGTDLTREIFPVVYVTTADGNHLLGDDEVGPRIRRLVEGRMRTPDGPRATDV